MIGRLFCLIALFMLASCAAKNREELPELTPVTGTQGHLRQCTAIFPKGSWQFVHDIAFHLTKGDGSAIGVLVLNDQEIRCALMTVEGLTLFEARSTAGGDMEVSRAIAPFDNQEFAVGLMRELRTIFQPPPGRVDYGRVATDVPVCRFSSADMITDILPQEDGCWSITTYSDRIKTKVIRASSCRLIDSVTIPEHLELVAPGAAGYTLNMHLISAERLPATN